MKVLVTGTEGYLGCLLPQLLIKRGHEVLGVDTGFYKVGWLFNGTDTTALTLNKDGRLAGCRGDRPHGGTVQRSYRTTFT